MAGLLLLFGVSFLPYLWLNRRPAKYYWKSRFDDHVPLIPLFIVPYLSIFFMVPMTLWFLRGHLLREFLLAFMIVNFSADIFWFLIPNGVKRPFLSAKIKPKCLFNLIYKSDKDTNGFPSGHVYTTLICVYFLIQTLSGNVFLSVAVILWGLSVVLSTVLVKQHYLIDIVGGILWAVLAVLASQFLLRG